MPTRRRPPSTSISGGPLNFPEKRGPHGLLLGLAADWNDCINLKGKGESVWSTFLYYRALTEFIELARRTGKDADVKLFTERRAEIKELIDTHAWDGEWFLRGYLDSGRKLGGRESEQSKIFLNSQSWAVFFRRRQRGKRPAWLWTACTAIS